MNIVESFGSAAATIGGGFFVGILVGYALKKVIKIAAVIVGLFLAGLAYLQSQHIANINWNKLQTVSEDAITTISNAVIQIQGISSGDGSHAAAALIAITSFGIPLTGSMSAIRFTIGFLKG
ncbi:MAG: FUN14 domain-containing protein [Nitrososphaeraceae archaeon]